MEVLQRSKHKFIVLKHANCVISLAFQRCRRECRVHFRFANINDICRQSVLSDCVSCVSMEVLRLGIYIVYKFEAAFFVDDLSFHIEHLVIVLLFIVGSRCELCLDTDLRFC